MRNEREATLGTAPSSTSHHCYHRVHMHLAIWNDKSFAGSLTGLHGWYFYVLSNIFMFYTAIIVLNSFHRSPLSILRVIFISTAHIIYVVYYLNSEIETKIAYEAIRAWGWLVLELRYLTRQRYYSSRTASGLFLSLERWVMSLWYRLAFVPIPSFILCSSCIFGGKKIICEISSILNGHSDPR